MKKLQTNAHQKNEKNIDYITGLEPFFKAIIGAYPEIIREEILSAASSHGILDAERFADIILMRDRKSSESSEKGQFREMAGVALAKLFFDTACNPLAIAKCVMDWDLWDQFEAAACSFMKYGTASVGDFKQRYELLITEWQDDMPRILRSGAEDAEAYKNYWAQETDVSEVWREDPFQDFGHAMIPAYNALKCLLPNHVRDLVDILDYVKFPNILSDTLWALHRPESLPEMLKLAPTTLADCPETDASWNKSLLAPAILKTASDCTYLWLEKGECQRAVDLWHALADVLEERADGTFLARAFLTSKTARLGFVQEIVTTESKNNSIICDEMVRLICLPDASEPVRAFKTIFSYPLEKAIEANSYYVQTGINVTQERGMTLSSLLAFLHSENKELEADNAIVFFNLLLAYDKAGLHTSEHFQVPDFRHQAIGRLYAESENPVESLRNTFKHLSGAWNRLRQSLFCENSLELRYAFNFVFTSALCAIDYLKATKPEMAKALQIFVKQKLFTYACLDWFQDKFMLILLNRLNTGESE